MRIIGVRTVTVSFLAILACGRQDRAGLEWLRPPPTLADSDWTLLPIADVHEVATSKQALATRQLAEASFVPLSDSETEFYSGFRGAAGPKRPFLVRAVFGHQGTGAYSVFRRGDDLFVRHSSLGHSSPSHKGALVVTLDFTPREIYTFMSIAE
jgi:hypothetical protein